MIAIAVAAAALEAWTGSHLLGQVMLTLAAPAGIVFLIWREKILR